jgi:hypothetical protein
VHAYDVIEHKERYGRLKANVMEGTRMAKSKPLDKEKFL